MEAYRPFPGNALPDPLDRYVKAAATAIGCDPAFVGLPCLAVCAGAIGNSRRIMLNRGWYEPAVLWASVIGESGTQKSPAMDAAIHPLERWQSEEFERHAEKMAQYDSDRQHYEAAKKKWNGTGDPPEKPEPPACVRYIVSDTTVEGLVPILQQNPRGVLLARDELAGWLGSFDKYAAGKSNADSAAWLSMHGARPVTVDRKTGDKRTLYVPRAAVSVCGTIQPAILNRALGTEHRESGLAARMLLACPPRTPKRWTDREIPEAIEGEYIDALDALLSLDMQADDDGRLQPGLVKLSPKARQLFIEFVNRHGEESEELSGELAAAYSKLEGAAARLSLLCTLIAGKVEVTDTAMQSAIELIEWFKHETRRVYSLFGESDGDREHRELVELVARLSDPELGITPNDLRRRSRKYTTSDEAEAALKGLVDAGVGQWHSPETGGRPARYFRLVSPVSVSGTPSNPEENGTSGYGYSVDNPQTTNGWATI